MTAAATAGSSIRESVLFVVMCLIGLGIQLGLQAIVTYGLGYKDGASYNIATAFGIGIATLFRLFAYRTFVFRALHAGQRGRGAARAGDHAVLPLGGPGLVRTAP